MSTIRPGYTKDKQKLQARLSRIEGQVRGIEHMVEDDRYCIDVLTQVNAVKAALDGVALLLLEDHVGHCVAEAIRGGRGAEKVQELTTAIGRYLQG
jgi:DNA-binding FrmR family transcriptional regulator